MNKTETERFVYRKVNQVFETKMLDYEMGIASMTKAITWGERDGEPKEEIDKARETLETLKYALEVLEKIYEPLHAAEKAIKYPT